jgi:acetyltransferase-like isoleucine patch superfamily enzyme
VRYLIRRYVKRLLPRSALLRTLYYFLHNHRTSKRIKGRHNRICAAQAIVRRCRIQVIGNNNTISIGAGSTLDDTNNYLRGNHLTLKIGEEVFFGSGSTIKLVDNHGLLEIGDRSTLGQVHLVVAEDHSSVRIGEECMFSAEIHLRCSDAHAIYEQESGKRTNFAPKIEVGDHVWVGLRAMILKGASIGSGSVIGASAVVTKAIPPNSVAVGNPARVVRSGVVWTRRRDLRELGAAKDETNEAALIGELQ